MPHSTTTNAEGAPTIHRVQVAEPPTSHIMVRHSSPTTMAVVVVPPPVERVRVPPGAPKGGVYREVRYCGPLSIACCVLTEFWCIAFCPLDRWFLYVAPDGTLWRADGAMVSPCFPYVVY